MGATKREQGRVIFDSPVLGKTITRTLKYEIGAAPTGSEQDTGIDLPAKCIVRDVFVDVTTAETTGATKTMNVGLLASESGGDADGFLVGISFVAAGLLRCRLISYRPRLGTFLSVE